MAVIPGVSGMIPRTGPLTMTYRGKLTANGTNTSYDPFSMGSANIGPPTGFNRVVVLVISWGRGAGTSNDGGLSSVSIEGIPATIIEKAPNDYQAKCAIAYASVPSGSSANVVVDWDWIYHARQTCFVFTVENVRNTVPYSTNLVESSATTLTGTINAVNNSVVITGISSYADAGTPVWTNVTLNGSQTPGDNQYHYAASGNVTVGFANVSASGFTGSTAKAMTTAAWK
jgi:hypothetical protein